MLVVVYSTTRKANQDHDSHDETVHVQDDGLDTDTFPMRLAIGQDRDQ
jgi:hypothetical protein